VLAGLAVTAILRSSTATGAMATSFAAKGAIDLPPALAVMLGANLGSTLINQLLALDIAMVAPALAALRQSFGVFAPSAGDRYPRACSSRTSGGGDALQEVRRVRFAGELDPPPESL
jgi:hypothetical protein